MLCQCTSISDVREDHAAFTFGVERSRLDLLTSEHKGTMMLQNVWNDSPNHTVFHPMRLQPFKIIIKTQNLARVNGIKEQSRKAFTFN